MNEVVQRTVTAALAGALFVVMYIQAPLPLFIVSWALLSCYLVYFEWLPIAPASGWRAWLLTMCYPVLPLCLVGSYALYHRHEGLVVAFYPLLVAWSYDSAAYIVGKLWGTHKICPSISPGKSWQGLIAGYGAVVLVHILIRHYGVQLPIFNVSSFMALALRSAVYTAAAFVGDLGESWLKRRAGVKDSGTVLPGHGGLLDRFDSVFAVIVLLTFEMMLR